MGTITIDEHLCKGCDLCVVACPFHIMVMTEKVNSMGYYVPKLTDEERCTACRICAWMCPDAAIEVYRTERRKARAERRI